MVSLCVFMVDYSACWRWEERNKAGRDQRNNEEEQAEARRNIEMLIDKQWMTINMNQVFNMWNISRSE